MALQTVYFTGSLPRKGQTPFGGGEVGNMRTIRMLKTFGYKVIAVRRLRSGAKESSIQRHIYYPIRIIANTIMWFFTLLFGNRKNGIAHVSGFYGKTIYVEIAQVFLAKLFCYRLIYELRGGGATQFYEKGNSTYQRQFRYILNKADYLLSQGKENEPLLQSLCNKPFFYYPNCVQKGFYPKFVSVKPKDRMNLLFFGRIEEEKNPLLIVEVAAILQRKYETVHLTMIGNGKKELLEQVRCAMEGKLTQNSFELLPGCEHNELQSRLLDKHFYIFPSVQPREGQSNAVTEAMSYGIIPIASPQGFNRSTIGDDRLIVDELSAEAYADRISSIIDNRGVEWFSNFVRNRFIEHYTEDSVFEKMKIVYQQIFGV